MTELLSHDILPGYEFRHIKYENRPVLDDKGKPVEGLHQTWISLNNEKQLNSYTTEAVKEVILAFRRASCDRKSSNVVFTAVGDRAFCTGGNTEEYATYYSNRPLEYLQYMRLFNDMVTNILLCDKPVICRVNGMRIGGGQEIGMACDFTVAGDHARFGQAGPKHGSAPDGGSTDFLDIYVGFSRAGREPGAVRALERAQGHANRLGQRAGAGAQDRRRQVHPEPLRRHRPLPRRHGTHRLRRVEGGQGQGRGQGARGQVHARSVAARSGRSTSSRPSCSTPSPTARAKPWRAPARRS